jgi:hypothetical protein
MGRSNERLDGREVKCKRNPVPIFGAAEKIFYGVAVLVLRDF